MADTLRQRRVPAPVAPPEAPPARRSRRINVISKAALEKAEQDGDSFLSGTRGAFAGIVLHLAVATLFLTIAEGWSLLDALYFAVVIATTVGYGDMAPTHTASKMFVAIYAVISVALIGGLLQALVERVAEAQRNLARGATSRLIASSSKSNEEKAQDVDFVVTAQLAVEKARIRFRGTVTLLLGACVSGAFLYSILLKVSLSDVVYFLVVSMTTVGLGDIHPVTKIGKAYALVWLVLSSLGFASLISQYADLRLKQREYELARKVANDDINDRMFSEIDGDNDGTLSEAEFLGFMLCKLGKASPDEVRGILMRFRELDEDHSGFITKEEVTSTVVTKKLT